MTAAAVYWRNLRRSAALSGSHLAEHPEHWPSFGAAMEIVNTAGAAPHERYADGFTLWQSMTRDPEVCDNIGCRVRRMERREADRRQRHDDGTGWAGTERRSGERRQA